jgi:small-conductance mechanosensitive channel
MVASDQAVPEKVRHMTEAVRHYAWPDLVWSLGVVAAAAVTGWLVAVVVMRSVQRWARHTNGILDDCVAEHIPRPVKLLLPATGVAATLPLVALPERVISALHHAVLLLIIVGLGWLMFRVVRVVEDVAQHRLDAVGSDDLQARGVRTQIRAFVNIAGFVICVVTAAFALMTFEAVRELGAGLLASAGLAGVVLGFAAQKSLGTLLAGIQIAIAQPIRVSDSVVLEGESGRIEEITLTYVVVRLWDLRRLIVPINYFIEKPFQNWTRVSSDLIGAVFLHLDYSVPVDDIRRELERLLHASPLWDKKTWGVQVTDANDRAMLVRMVMSAKDSTDAFNLRCEMREKMIAFLQRKHPDGLPLLRPDVSASPARPPATAG